MAGFGQKAKYIDKYMCKELFALGYIVVAKNKFQSSFTNLSG
ncbi:hypothetical protein Mpsy_1150 [Methanolobus psychrophilus R15]|nr:hypothetical protein Mpsy_1150 [Methanolobus psychrophilus R15]